MWNAHSGRKDASNGGWPWVIVCLLLVLPITAVLHHAIFFPGMCMLNRIGPDYYPAVIAQWLSRDPSPLLALVGAAAAWYGGRRNDRVRGLIWPLLIAFLPLTVWLWDIPFTGRAICLSFHDGHLRLASGEVISSRHFYIAAVPLYAAVLAGYTIVSRRAGVAAQTSAAE